MVFGLGALAAASVISTSAIFLFVTKGACVVRLIYVGFRKIQVGELAEEAAQCSCFQIAKGRVRKGSRNISVTEGRRRLYHPVGGLLCVVVGMRRFTPCPDCEYGR